MKICLFSPYIPNHFGGGEKYLFDVAKILKKKHDVFIAISGIHGTISAQTIVNIRKNYEKFLGYSLAHIQFISTPLGSSAFFLNKLFWTRKFDVMYYQTDGSLFFSLARRNILHIQVPLILDKSSFLDRYKLAHWSVKNTNSFFTKKVIEKYWKTPVDVVHHPMLSSDVFLSASNQLKDLSSALEKKQKIILHVGRFFRHQHSKKQEVLVEIFKKMRSLNPEPMKDWKLVLIGSVEDKKYANRIKVLAKGHPIEIYHEVKREKLLEWYRTASLYWHATGFGIDEEAHPEKMEHFGISTAEAMASGCVPVVIHKGGQPEVLGDELHQWLWKSKAECIQKTLELVGDPQLRLSQQLKAIQRAETFSEKVFAQKLNEMIKD